MLRFLILIIATSGLVIPILATNSPDQHWFAGYGFGLCEAGIYCTSDNVATGISATIMMPKQIDPIYWAQSYWVMIYTVSPNDWFQVGYTYNEDGTGPYVFVQIKNQTFIYTLMSVKADYWRYTNFKVEVTTSGYAKAWYNDTMIFGAQWGHSIGNLEAMGETQGVNGANILQFKADFSNLMYASGGGFRFWNYSTPNEWVEIPVLSDYPYILTGWNNEHFFVSHAVSGSGGCRCLSLE